MSISVSKQKYRDFLRSDCGNTFAEYLGIKVPEIEYKENKCRFRRKNIIGDWCLTKKDAKESYKIKLKKDKTINEGQILN